VKRAPLRVVSVASNKGGVGKTTLAVNLAVLARAANPSLPVLLVGFDDQDLIDRMFGDESSAALDLAKALRNGDLRPAIRAGRYGVHYVPTSPEISELKAVIREPDRLRAALERSGFQGLVVVDTKSDLEILTQNAIWASDLTLVPVADQTSLLEAEKVFRLLERFGRTPEQACIVLSLVDLRIKYRRQEHEDVLAWLVAQIRERQWPLLETFISRSPRVEALHTNTGIRPLPVLEGARDSLVCVQLRHLANDVLQRLPLHEAGSPARFERRAAPRVPYHASGVAFRAAEPRLVEFDAHDLSTSGLGASTQAKLAAGERVHVALRRPAGRPALLWARVVHAGNRQGFAFERAQGDAVEALGELLRAQASASGARVS
jgi:cellulose biosynthesis protein BcsQ